MVCSSCSFLEDREAAGDDGQGAAAELPGHPVRGGADVEQHGLAVLDQLCAPLGDRVLLATRTVATSTNGSSRSSTRRGNPVTKNPLF